ncbi:hypothetical protein CDEN61S_02711 [Castellaniella denitrificans]
MVAGDGVGRRQSREDVGAPVRDGRDLAVHEFAGAHDASAVGRADGLVAQADAQDGLPAGEMPDQLDGDAGLGRRARPRRHADAVGVDGLDAGEVDLVVAHDLDPGAEFAEILHQVVGEGVVVVQHQQLHDRVVLVSVGKQARARTRAAKAGGCGRGRVARTWSSLESGAAAPEIDSRRPMPARTAARCDESRMRMPPLRGAPPERSVHGRM